MGYVSKVFKNDELLNSVTEIAKVIATYDRICLSETNNKQPLPSINMRLVYKYPPNIQIKIYSDNGTLFP